MAPNASIEQIFREAGRTINVTAYVDYREYLDAVYVWLKKTRGSYSYVAFSVDLGLGKSNMVHLAVRGKRNLRAAGIQKICNALELKGMERRYLEVLHVLATTRCTTKREQLMSRVLQMKQHAVVSILGRSHYEYYSTWYHPVVRELVACPEFDGTPEWISAHVVPQISTEEAVASLELLERCQLIERDTQTGRLNPRQLAVLFPDGTDPTPIRRYHETMMDLGKRAIDDFSEDKREVRCFTLAVSPTGFNRLKLALSALQAEIMEIAGTDSHPNQVVQLNVQLFPVSQPPMQIRGNA